MVFKKLVWIIKRHPFLYITRFRLLSKNSNIEEIKKFTYNNTNSKKDIPTYYFKINAQILKNYAGNKDLDFVTYLSVWLRKRIKGGPGLSVSSDKALEMMLDGKGGVCSDFVQIFNNFCVINNVKVREWGVTNSPFNKHYGGHSFNEVYCEELKKWVFIDSYWGVFFYNTSDVPISVLELFHLIRAGETVDYKQFHKVEDFKDKTFKNNFFNSNSTPFLICNYSNKVYDSFLNYLRPYLPVFMIHFILYILHKSCHFRFPIDNYKRIFS